MNTDEKTVTRVYKYGCKAPTENYGWCKLIASRAARYRNDLIALKNERMKATTDAERNKARSKSSALRATCGLWYGTYALVERDVQKAKNFRSFDGTGRIGGYLNNGTKLAVAAIFEPHKNLHLEHLERLHYNLKMRIGGSAKEPVIGVWPMKLHRPLPENGVIVQCWVQVLKIGRKEKWELCLCVKEPLQTTAIINRVPAVGLDLGWRVREGTGYRVGMLSTGEELTCPPSIRSGLEHYEGITSVRRLAFDAMRPNDSFRSPDRLNRRVASGEFPELEGWQKQDSHLWDWIANGRAKVLARRKHHYTGLARSLVKKYDTIVIEKLNLARLATKKDGVQRGNRVDVAPAEFRMALKQAAVKFSCLIVEVPAPGTTSECFNCREKMEVGSKLIHVCEHCGAEHDQDLNAAKNILRKWRDLEPLANDAAAE